MCTLYRYGVVHVSTFSSQTQVHCNIHSTFNVDMGATVAVIVC